MALTWSYAAHSEVGLIRTSNQDSAYVSPTMLLVADGMGGAAAGDLASAVATWELERTDRHLDERIAAAHAEREQPESDEESGSTQPPAASDRLADLHTVLQSALATANNRLVELVEDDPQLAGMGTTVCGFALVDDRVAVVNIGDSRAYLIRGGELRRVTKDHSWVQTLVDEGRITDVEALSHPHRNLVMRVLNGSEEYTPDLSELEVVAGDRLLVCSDGLCGLVTDEAIAAVATAGHSREETVTQLVGLAHAAGGHDNITLIVADVQNDGPSGIAETVGAAAALTEGDRPENTTPIPVVTESTPEEVEDRAVTEAERYALQGGRRWSTRIRVALAVILPLMVLAGGAALWFQYTQTKYYVGPEDGNVALFRGVPDPVPGLPLSTLVERDTTRISDLPPYYATKVQANIRVESLNAAQATLIELREKAQQCIEQRATRLDPPATTSPSPNPSSPSPTPPSMSASQPLSPTPVSTEC
ncbi:MAG: PP2C family protein-serine/threonine phosphatase [Propioniciclava sp.]